MIPDFRLTIGDLKSKIRNRRSKMFFLASLLLSILIGCTGIPQTTGVYRSRETNSAKDAQAARFKPRIEWRASFKEATEVARAQKKPMMLVFYGISCKRLDERVFSAPDVVELAQEFVCLKIGAGQGDLTQKYGLQQFPTIVFVDPQGAEYDRLVGYRSWPSFVQILRTALIPIEAEYSLQIEPLMENGHPPRSARVKCVFRNVRSKSLTLVLREKHDRVFNISYDSTDGRPGWEEMEKNIWLMKFNTPALKTATIQYEVGLNIMSSVSYQSEYISYVGDDYGVLDGRALFLAPHGLHIMGKIEVHLDLPSGWHAITPWRREEGARRRGGEDSLPHSLAPPLSLSHTASSVEEVVDSVFCIGQFQFAERRFGEHKVYAVHCGVKESSPDLEQKADEVAQVFKDYVMRFGDFPFRRYLAVFTKPTPNGKYITGSSAHGVGFAGPINGGYSFVAHEVFHVWNGGMITQRSDYEGWFKEGFTQYYGYLTPYRVGLYSKERFLRHLKKDYEGYLKRYGTSDDMALTRVKEELARKESHDRSGSARLWIMYHKGALVASLMDDEIKERTGGLKSLDDLMRYMFHEFREREYSSEDVLAALNTVTGQDFAEFFSDFVYGTTKLPPIAANANRPES
jgi:predicted metalloprotease with PDZ domain/thioredoxin-related protein